jgi:hypothetical protein
MDNSNKVMWNGYGETWRKSLNRMHSYTFKTTGTTYSSWKQCYDGKLKSQSDSSNNAQYTQLKEFMNKGGYDFLAAYEEKL